MTNMKHKRLPFFIGGNWKMNGSSDIVQRLAGSMKLISWESDKVQVVVAPPFPYLKEARALYPSSVALAAQNASEHLSGAYTGETSVEFLKDIGASWVILGHSERRTLFGEGDELIGKKLKRALDSNLAVILCIGEPLAVREAKETIAYIEAQMKALLPFLPRDARQCQHQLVIAYEPIWAIGTGKVATSEQAQEAHQAIRSWVSKNLSPEIAAVLRIIYGGSVNAANANSLILQQDVDGFLIGGASLTDDFCKIIQSANSS